ncbi:LYR motif-containing protein 2 [Aspergillus homomorphus CBS 101889]|uniref:Complex 1 LYR protein domain-containing protein n=1 Tax=Aspergillus homomorphus (strain CBS 101889) TaxID=1450537 RepID=A0A395I6W0_ASPHC|nr:hypothetical protein BO97DRAFT_431683 [Aspergillus homomorphus CBS 101889]RAL15932.1 hypothetical protein BO97DRAFT_431683 [Aspergillus homomorphus CBS 101889]
MRTSLQLLASISRSQPSKLRKPTVGLDHFIQRQRVIALWREIVRALNAIPNSPTRDELRNYARNEFERHRDVTDLTGKAEFETMRRYIDEQIVG